MSSYKPEAVFGNLESKERRRRDAGATFKMERGSCKVMSTDGAITATLSLKGSSKSENQDNLPEHDILKVYLNCSDLTKDRSSPPSPMKVLLVISSRHWVLFD